MSLTDEIFEVADQAAAVLTQAHDDGLARPLSALRTACEEAKRAWSGSNIGYHANIYYDGLEPAPPHAQFSPEWGLMDRWPVHQPDPGWGIMDPQQVRQFLLDQAGIADLDSILSKLAALRQKLSDLKETGIGLLTTAAREHTGDSFIARQLQHVEQLRIATPDEIRGSLIPRQVWSRDSQALAQGTRAAPHQALLAVYLSAKLVENGLETLEKACRATASHVGRQGKLKRRQDAVGTNVFIGHGRSKVWRDLKDFIHDRLRLPYDEFNRVPVAGVTNIARLSEMLDAAAVAFVILTGEDEQADGSFRARENVVHEVGLFQGRIGFTKAIVLLEEGCEQFSNIEGLGQIRYPKGNVSAVFEEIRRVLEREGLLEANNAADESV